jgi:hypothetical protein
MFMAILQTKNNDCQFCTVDGQTRLRILKKLAEIKSAFRAAFIRDSKSEEGALTKLPLSQLLASTPPYPSSDIIVPVIPPHPSRRRINTPCGISSTAPWPTLPFSPASFGLSDERAPRYRKAGIRGRGRITTWTRKYLALVDGDDGDVVYGSAYLIEDVEDDKP